MVRSDRVLDRVDSLETVKRLGKGSFGETLLVRDPQTSRLYALKKLLPGRNEEKYFSREVDALKSSSDACAHIPKYFESKVSGNNYYILMEYVVGKTLDKVYEELSEAYGKSGDIIPRTLMYTIATGMISAVQCLHSQGIAHRDIKLENAMLIQSHGELKIRLLDLGFSCFLWGINDNRKECDHDYKGSGGTLTYFSPELGSLTASILNGNPNVYMSDDEIRASDVWALGIALYELANGKHPLYKYEKYAYEEYSYFLDTLKVENNQSAIPWSMYRDEKINNIIDKCLQVDWRQRATARELLDMIQSA